MSQSFSSLLAKVLSASADSLRVAIPARVESYDSARQAVNVLPLVEVPYTDEEGNEQFEALPVIPRVPVVFPGANGFRVTFPIVAGDTVLLVFADRSIDAWLDRGGLVEPTDARSHDLADAIAIPGLRSFRAPLSSAPTDAMTVGSDTGDAVIEIDSGEIRAGGSDALAMLSELNSLKDAFNSHTHPTPSGVSSATTLADRVSADYPGTSVLKGG